MVDVLVVGSGGREHAITWKLLASRQVSEVFVAPGNAGTALIARNIDLDPLDTNAVVQAAVMRGVRLVVVGPEAPLAQGLVDELCKLNIAAFGPTRAAAEIEWSKVFAKDLMRRYNIPCARSQVFESLGQAKEFLDRVPPPVVIKADGLAAGKGVTVAFTRDEAERALSDCLERQIFGQSGRRVLIEEYLEGPEVSLLAFTDGKTIVPMVPATDFKRAYDDDQGPNTGGMGAYSPPSFASPEILERATREILEPTVTALAQEGRPYQGVLYAGLMLTGAGPKALEFNCRFGDPETQVVLPRLDSDLLDIMLACTDGTLDRVPVNWSSEAAVGVVVAAQGYPGQYTTGHQITGFDRLDDGVLVFHSGTRQQARPAKPPSRFGKSMYSRVFEIDEIFNDIVTAGGRVLTVVGRGATVAEARGLVYRNIGRLEFAGARYRTDIAARESAGPDAWGAAAAGEPPAAALSTDGARERLVTLPEPTAEERAALAPAEAALSANRPADAVALLGTILQERPDSLAARITRANAHGAAGNLPAAREDWQAVVARVPRAAEAHHNLGVVCLHAGDLAAALHHIREALRLDPGYVMAHCSLAAILAGRGDTAEAISHYEAALAIHPGNVAARLDLADVLAQSGQRDRATMELERCLTAQPDAAQRAEIDARLKRLKKRRWFG